MRSSGCVLSAQNLPSTWAADVSETTADIDYAAIYVDFALWRFQSVLQSLENDKSINPSISRVETTRKPGFQSDHCATNTE